MFRIFTRAAASRPAETTGQGHRINEFEDDEQRLVMLKWHIERYDRLRASTASRAAVVLSAGAILSAGNALVLSQMLSTARTGLAPWWLAVLTVASLASAGLVVLSVLKAANVLVTIRRSRDAFEEVGHVPVSLIFNGTDTLANVRTFDDFRTVLAGESVVESRLAAEVELWVCIHQHRHRYTQLRAAVRLLRHAAVAFFAILVLAVSANLVHAFTA